MKFDTILTGGGLSALVCGIKLQKAGHRCLMVSSGQNALHFSSGTFGLLARLPDGTEVTAPVDAISKLGPEHPYSKIGAGKVHEYASAVPQFFSDCGVPLHFVYEAAPGAAIVNGYRLSATGTLKSAWLAMKEVSLLASKDEKIGNKALIVNFSGFLDFNTAFLAEGLGKRGLECRTETVKVGDVENLRKNPSEMRSVGIARVMVKEQNWKGFARQVRELIHGEDLIILPEVFGLQNQIVLDWLQEMIPAKVMFVGTIPPSVPGIRTQILLKKAFEDAGGTFLMGDEVHGPLFDGNHVLGVCTSNLGSMKIEADSFVLASGNLFGKGLEATPERVYEPVFGLDVKHPVSRNEWYDEDFFADQAYTGFGVSTDNEFRAFRNGSVIDNLYVIGAELGGCNPLAEGSGAGVAIMTALGVADEILNKQ